MVRICRILHWVFNACVPQSLCMYWVLQIVLQISKSACYQKLWLKLLIQLWRALQSYAFSEKTTVANIPAYLPRIWLDWAFVITETNKQKTLYYLFLFFFFSFHQVLYKSLETVHVKHFIRHHWSFLYKWIKDVPFILLKIKRFFFFNLHAICVYWNNLFK